MSKKISLKTAKNESSVDAYINALPSETAQQDARQLDEIMQRVTGAPARMWGKSMVGYGEYVYHRANGDEGRYMATGFSLRKSGPVVYIMPGYEWADHLLADLGPHRLGKSCLYLKRLSDVDLQVLEQLVKDGLTRLQNSHSVDL